MPAILIAGFGNLGAKLLPLRWAFPHVDFYFVEKYYPAYQAMKNEFDGRKVVAEFLQSKPQVRPHSAAKMNLSAFHEALSTLKALRPKVLESEIRCLKEVFEEHVFYCGDPKDVSPKNLRHEERRYKQDLIEELTKRFDKADVLLYLACRPEDYFWYLQRYAPFASRVAVDKPLATSLDQLDKLIQFSRLNPDLDIRPIDHYLFKLNFTEFNKSLDNRPGGLDPKGIERIEVIIHEEGLDEHRPYFIQTGIIRDMMPHVAAMLRYMFRHNHFFMGYIGNVTPVVHKYKTLSGRRRYKSTIVNAMIDINYWTGCYNDPSTFTFVPATIKLAKGMSEGKKQIRVYYRGNRSNQSRSETIDLAQKPRPNEGVFVDWGAALQYLMENRPSESVESHFTFERACEITREVLVCHQQADRKVSAGSKHSGDIFFLYNEEHNKLPPIERKHQKVFVFNFDGVIVNTESAHKRAWNTWFETLGAKKPFPDVGKGSKGDKRLKWFEPGKPNQVMINEALRELARVNQIDPSFAIEHSQKLYHLFRDILRSEKLSFLSTIFVPAEQFQAVEDDRSDVSILERDLARLKKYHDGLLRFLDELRQHNYVLILASTNHPLLVQQTLDTLLSYFEQKNKPRGAFFTGLCRYLVGQRSGMETYKRIIEQYSDYGSIVVFDDYEQALDSLSDFAEERRLKNLHLVHMHTSGRRCGCQRGYKDFDDVMKRFREFL